MGEHTTTGKFTALKTEFIQKMKETKDGHDENYQLLNTALDNLSEKVDLKEDTMDSKFTSLKTEFTLQLKETKESNDNDYQLLNTALDNLKGKVDQRERFEVLELQINETIIELKKGVNECQTDPCQNQGTCTDIQNGYTCTCVPGFTGINCEVNFDDCSENPCVHGMCMDLINSYKCTCETGYYGSNCDSQTPPCSTSEPNYHLIDNKCYFFEKTSATWEKAKEGCKNKFPAGGKLFEPMTLAENKLVFNAASINTVFSAYGNFWIGVTDTAQEGSFRYDSNSSPVSYNMPWYDGYGKRGTRKYCVLVHTDPGKWLDYPCSSLEYRSICEPNV